MLKLKNLLVEQGNLKSFTIQTPAPKSMLDIVRSTKPRGAAFILKSTDVLGETPSMDSIINLLKLDDRFGENSIWAQTLAVEEEFEGFVYVFSDDFKDSQRKTKFNVMIVPRTYIFEMVLGTDITDDTKITAVNDLLVTKYSIGNASVMLQPELDKLKTDIAPYLNTERLKKLEAENAKLQQALDAKSEPEAQSQYTLSADQTATSDVAATASTTENKAQALLTKLKDAPIKLNTSSDDVLYIQDLMYRIGMASPKLAEKNDVASWVAFRDAKPQYGTYGTRTKNFIDAIKTWKGLSTTNDNITTEVLQAILDAGKGAGITESRNSYYADKFIYEQFEISADIDKAVTSTSSKSSSTTNKTKTTKTSTATGTFHPIGTAWDKLDYKTPIKQGDKGQEVKAMQIFINGINAAQGETNGIAFPKQDGVYGHLTHEAAKMAAFRIPSDTSGYITIKTPASLSDWSKQFTAWKSYADKPKLNGINQQTIKESDEMDKIWDDLFKVIQNSPENYFGKMGFKGWVNDDENGAADWFIKAFNDAWGTTLTRLSKSKSTYIQTNVKNIRWTVKHIANELIRTGHSGHVNVTYYYINTGDTEWHQQKLKLRWDYM
jgi:hypothetical protein